jgi:7 transmembrane receptor (rhodopsin family)
MIYHQNENGYFFAIIFSFIFAPLLITFFWLNSVLAKEVWKRRANVSITASENENTSTVSTGNTGYVTPEVTARRVERKQRQIRMFKVILVLMAVFFICRLPHWIYILYKLHSNLQENIHWVINYALGLMVMANCMFNPFLYTFLSETIRLTTFLAGIVCGIFSPCMKLCKTKKPENEFEKPKLSSNL